MELLTRVASLHVEEYETKGGATALTFAASKRRTRIVDMLSAPLSSLARLLPLLFPDNPNANRAVLQRNDFGPA